MNNEYSSILQENPMLMVFALEARMDLPHSDALHYLDVVCEAAGSEGGRAALMNALYSDIQKISEVDFGRIADSKGDLTKYMYYDQLHSAILAVIEMSDRGSIKNVELLNKLHQILLTIKPDLVFGFKTNNFIIICTYKVMVAALYELVQICAIDCTSELRKKLGTKDDTKTVNEANNICVKNVQRFVKMYETGEWANVVKVLRKNAPALEALMIEDALEADTLVPNSDELVDLADAIRPGFGQAVGMIKDRKAKIAAGPAGKAMNSALGALTSTPAKWIGGIIALFFIIRALIKYFYRAAFSIGNYAKTNAQIMRAAMAADSDGDAPGVKAQKKYLSILEGVSDFVSYRIFKTNKEAEKDIKESTRANLSTTAIKSASGQFEF